MSTAIDTPVEELARERSLGVLKNPVLIALVIVRDEKSGELCLLERSLASFGFFCRNCFDPPGRSSAKRNRADIGERGAFRTGKLFLLLFPAKEGSESHRSGVRDDARRALCVAGKGGEHHHER